jgi:hypothetical protein
VFITELQKEYFQSVVQKQKQNGNSDYCKDYTLGNKITTHYIWQQQQQTPKKT